MASKYNEVAHNTRDCKQAPSPYNSSKLEGATM